MAESRELLGYLQQGIDQLLEQEGFDGGQDFRRTQKQALEAYKRYLNDDNLTIEQKLKGFFEIPTGVGKTAVFVGIVAAAHKAAEENGDELKTAIVVPTRQLLEQTIEAFQGNGKPKDDPKYFGGFAPWMKGIIGQYGDGKKNLKSPLTIMTYEAFTELTEADKLSSENIDILISDEAHRGTSERRVENITAAFNANTVQLAFTATAHFDSEKSVENSHEREIFYKSPADAIREGELAAYVSSQRFVIRVDPDDYMLSDEFAEASQERRAAYRRAAKQNAWNKRMVTIFREGRDEKTGDLLTDTQAGFFVEGIRQAEKLEDLLNDDLELVKRAEEQGYEGVAVAIHSKMSKTEIKRRYDDYKAGKYLAVIGDDMFKEGFDHPPMKTLFDCPHTSVVDKAQILGRGLRKWWNDLKGRFEGLTVIDTAVYFADEDPDKEAKNREYALMDTVSVKQVLETSRIDGPDAPARPGSTGGPPGGGGSLFDDDPDVEEYTTVESLYELEQEIDDLNEAERLRQEQLWKNNPLTVADIKATIEAYRKENGGSNPTSNHGEIAEGPLAGRIAWYGVGRAINSAAQGSGHGNGLADDSEYKTYLESLDINENPELASMLVYLGFAEKKLKLTMADIKATIEAYRQENNEQNPTQKSGDIITGPLAGRMRWDGLNSSIARAEKGTGYGNGLSDDPEYQKYITSLNANEKPGLSSMLAYLSFTDKKLLLTMADIKATIEAYREANNSENPVGNSNEISEGPLAGRITWGGLSQVIAIGSNNLRDDPEYQTYLKNLNRHEAPGLPSALAYFGFADKKQPLTVADIKASIEAYREANNDENPSDETGKIIAGPLAGRITWLGVTQAVKNGGSGLKDDPEYQKYIENLRPDDIAGLASLKIYLGFQEEQSDLTMADIKATIEAYRKENNGKNPTMAAEEITAGPLAGKFQWAGLSEAIKYGRNNLDQDPEYQKFIKTLKKGENPGLHQATIYFGFKLKLTMSSIEETVYAYRKENEGKNPTQKSGPITVGPLAGHFKWSQINDAFRLGGKSLSEDPDYIAWKQIEPKPSLISFLRKMDADKQQKMRGTGPSLNGGP